MSQHLKDHAHVCGSQQSRSTLSEKSIAPPTITVDIEDMLSLQCENIMLGDGGLVRGWEAWFVGGRGGRGGRPGV